MSTESDVAAMREEIHRLKTQVRHLTNDLKLTREDYDQSSERYFDLYVKMERKVEERTLELKRANDLLKQEIEDRKKTASALKIEKEFISAVLANSHDGIAVITADGKVKLFSPGMERIFGIAASKVSTAEELARRAFFNPQQGMDILLAANNDKKCRPHDRVLQIRDKNHRERWARFQSSHMPDGSIVVSGQDLTEIKMAEQRIKHMALHDPLTGLPNRTHVQDHLRRAIAQARRVKGYVAVLFVDLDGFKSVNDEKGHEAGDRVLKNVAGRLLTSMREMDTVSRIGGDEFLIILPVVKVPEEAAGVAHRVIRAITAPMEMNGCAAALGASVGVSIYPMDGDHVDKLLNCADAAMYEAKNMGGNRFRFSSRQFSNAESLHQAL